jgi:hypothetical protein
LGESRAFQFQYQNVRAFRVQAVLVALVLQTRHQRPLQNMQQMQCEITSLCLVETCMSSPPRPLGLLQSNTTALVLVSAWAFSPPPQCRSWSPSGPLPKAWPSWAARPRPDPENPFQKSIIVSRASDAWSPYCVSICGCVYSNRKQPTSKAPS